MDNVQDRGLPEVRESRKEDQGREHFWVEVIL
jgi:hypothetical protein